MTVAEQQWERFMAQVEKDQPPSKEAGKTSGYIVSFLGSVEKYKKQFLKANEPDKSTWID